MRICQGKLSHLSLPLLQIKREVLEVGPGTATGGFQLGRRIHSASLFSDLVHFPLFDAVSCFAHGAAQQAQSTWWWFWCWTWGGSPAGFVPRPSAQRTSAGICRHQEVPSPLPGVILGEELLVLVLALWEGTCWEPEQLPEARWRLWACSEETRWVLAWHRPTWTSMVCDRGLAPSGSWGCPGWFLPGLRAWVGAELLPAGQEVAGCRAAASSFN